MNKISSFLTLEASIENLYKVNEFINAWTEKANFDCHIRKEVALAVEEVYVNIAKYAYPESKGKVSIYCKMDRQNLVIQLKDMGIPFDPLKLPNPDLSLDLKNRKIGGLGIFLMRNLVDKVKYERKKKYNLLTLHKKIKL